MLELPGGPMEVTTYRPLGETCDMKPNRLTAGSPTFTSEFTWNELHRITFRLAMVMSLAIGTSAYRPLSLRGPSRSRPKALPFAEKEWQFAQVGIFPITTRLSGSARLRIRHLISGSA